MRVANRDIAPNRSSGGAAISGVGTKLTRRDVRCMVALSGKTDIPSMSAVVMRLSPVAISHVLGNPSVKPANHLL